MDVIDFANGQPSSNELPDDLILQATAHALGAAPGGRDCAEGREASSEPLEYGDFTIRFRAELSKFLGRCDPSRGGVEPDPARLLPTGGVSQALDMLCTVCASPRARDVVLVETPTYFLASAIFRDHELEVRGVETDAEGIVPAALRASLEGLRAEGRKCAFLYVIPVHHNPTGRTMTDARRREVVDLAGAHGALVVADEVYTLLTYGSAATPPSLSTLGDGVLSLGSFAKVLAPGLRVGWVEGSRTLMDKLGAWSVTISGGYVSHFASCIVASALEQRLADQHLSRLRELYERRLAAMLAALHTHLPEACEQLCPPSGGYFVWLHLPPGVSAAELVKAARSQNLLFKEGDAFLPDAGSASLDRFVRLCFARLSDEEILEGTKRLAVLLRAACADTPIGGAPQR